MPTLSERFESLQNFYTNEIWNLDLEKEPKYRRIYFGAAKVIILGIIGIRDDKVSLRASALTYFTLLSIVPVLAMAFGLAKGFGMDKVLEQLLLENVQGQEEIFKQSLDFAKNLLATTQGGLVAGIGLVFLFYTVMKLLNNIEESFNDIWYVHKERNLTRKLTDYITIMLVGPILLILASSLTVFVKAQIQELTYTVELIGLFKGMIFPLLNLLPYTVMWLLFTLVYMIMPNTTVNVKSAIIAGIIAGSMFQLLEVLFIKFGVNVSRYNAIYGSFAALPLFLIWLQTSWIIVLFGSELSYAHQNVNRYESNAKGEGFSIAFKKKLSLAVSLLIIRNFKEGKKALSVNDINSQIKVPNKLLLDILSKLKHSGILSELNSDEEDKVFQPAIDTDLLTISFILNTFESFGKSEEFNDEEGVMELVDEVMQSINTIIEQSGANKLVKLM